MEKSMKFFAALFSVSEADVTQGHHSIGKKIHMSITILILVNKQSLYIDPEKIPAVLQWSKRDRAKDITVLVGCCTNKIRYTVKKVYDSTSFP